MSDWLIYKIIIIIIIGGGGHSQQQATPPPQVTPTNDWLCKLPISLEDDQPDLHLVLTAWCQFLHCH